MELSRPKGSHMQNKHSIKGPREAKHLSCVLAPLGENSAPIQAKGCKKI